MDEVAGFGDALRDIPRLPPPGTFWPKVLMGWGFGVDLWKSISVTPTLFGGGRVWDLVEIVIAE